jgi:hypothetical protein
MQGKLPVQASYLNTSDMCRCDEDKKGEKNDLQ